MGAGTSGRLGVLDASECPPTFSVPSTLVQGFIAGGDRALRHSSEQTEDQPEQGARDLLQAAFTERDTLVGIAASGRTPYVLGALEQARTLGGLTIALTCVPNSKMAALADLAITPVTGAEVVTGSTRMKAGTATKLVLNMLSTGVMIRTGAVFGNLMVNVKPSNAKLVDRAHRIIAAATGLHARTAPLSSSARPATSRSPSSWSSPAFPSPPPAPASNAPAASSAPPCKASQPRTCKTLHATQRRNRPRNSRAAVSRSCSCHLHQCGLRRSAPSHSHPKPR